MIKILMLTSNSSLMDGINRHILNISAEINKLDGFSVAVCTVMPEGELNTTLKEAGVKTYSLGFPNGHCLGIIPSYINVIKDFQPDIIHCHVISMMERITSSVLFRKIHYAITIHGILDKADQTSIRTKTETIIKKIFKIPFSACFYISNGVKDAYKNKFLGCKINETCYNPIKFEGGTGKKYKLHDIIKIPHKTQIIGTACRIAYSKNPQAFTTVMCKVLQAIPDAHAAVMGEGAENIIAECKDIISKAGVRERFHWLGYLNNAPQLISDLDCYIMTSRWEGLPTTILECMAMKTPVAIMKGAGGLGDLAAINEKEGPFMIFAEQGDSEGMANSIISLMKNPEQAKALAENAYKIGKKYFDIKSITNQLENSYKLILQ